MSSIVWVQIPALPNWMRRSNSALCTLKSPPPASAHYWGSRELSLLYVVYYGARLPGFAFTEDDAQHGYPHYKRKHHQNRQNRYHRFHLCKYDNRHKRIRK